LTPLGELTEEKQLQSTNQRSILHQVVPFSIADWFPFRLPKWFPFQLPFPLFRGKPADSDLDGLKVIESSELVVELTFNGFDKALPPVRHHVLADRWKRQLKREPLRQAEGCRIGNRKGNHLMQNTPLVG